ncbi:hypothetical protein ACFV80_42845 [Streptomyces sp. NPDC059862]|uniref:hypothetical protein n=1 Tax=Streptomyces sp. NPDC059862 TaxID=3346975 RepID=UPI00364D2A27
MREELTRSQPEPEPEPRPEPTAQSWRRIDWTKVGTIAAAIAGIGSLLFTGVATYYGARVSQDQLEQSRADTERASRAQAQRISYWEDRAQDSTLRAVHVMNRSPDPIADIFIRMTVGQGKGKRSAHVSLHRYNLAPCTVMTIQAESVLWRPTRESTWSKLTDAEGPTLVSALEFWDRDGQMWHRDPATLNHEFDPDPGAGYAKMAGVPPVQRATSCEDGRQ